MFSARSLARLAPRVILRSSNAVIPKALYPSILMIQAAAAPPSAHAAFSTTIRRAAASDTDGELSAKLLSEIQIEEDMKTDEQEPSSIKDFLNNSAFELIDIPGHEVVKLVRNYGNEKITVRFSVSDIANFDPYSEDNALEDERPEDANNSQINPRPDQETEESGEEYSEESPPSIDLSIIIEKSGKAEGALVIEASAQDGDIVVENLFYYADARIANNESPEFTHKRADIYPGPPFGSLDDDLQVLTERFLEERGITQALATFLPDYVDIKEQREYNLWLKNVKDFIDA